jgi:hypothetical protein
MFFGRPGAMRRRRASGFAALRAAHPRLRRGPTHAWRGNGGGAAVYNG